MHKPLNSWEVSLESALILMLITEKNTTSRRNLSTEGAALQTKSIRSEFEYTLTSECYYQPNNGQAYEMTINHRPHNKGMSLQMAKDGKFIKLSNWLKNERIEQTFWHTFSVAFVLIHLLLST